MKGIFVTGTDTGIGKTVVSAALMSALRLEKRVCYWKPVQTGIEEDNDTETVRRLASCKESEIFDDGIRLEKPLSPHLSARLAEVEISIGQILAFLPEKRDDRFWIVEGAGGILVPLNRTELMIDLIKSLRLPILIVSRSGLGTINHTLLTLETLRRFELEIIGVIMNGPLNPENKLAIEHYGQVRVFAELPPIEELNPVNLADWSSRLQNIAVEI